MWNFFILFMKLSDAFSNSYFYQAKGDIFNQLECPVFLDSEGSQNSLFTRFLGKEHINLESILISYFRERN